MLWCLKYEGLGKYDILALDKSFVVTLVWVISIPGEANAEEWIRVLLALYLERAFFPRSDFPKNRELALLIF